MIECTVCLKLAKQNAAVQLTVPMFEGDALPEAVVVEERVFLYEDISDAGVPLYRELDAYYFEPVQLQKVAA